MADEIIRVLASGNSTSPSRARSGSPWLLREKQPEEGGCGRSRRAGPESTRIPRLRGLLKWPPTRKRSERATRAPHPGAPCLLARGREMRGKQEQARGIWQWKLPERGERRLQGQIPSAPPAWRPPCRWLHHLVHGSNGNARLPLPPGFRRLRHPRLWPSALGQHMTCSPSRFGIRLQLPRGTSEAAFPLATHRRDGQTGQAGSEDNRESPRAADGGDH